MVPTIFMQNYNMLKMVWLLQFGSFWCTINYWIFYGKQWQQKAKNSQWFFLLLFHSVDSGTLECWNGMSVMKRSNFPFYNITHPITGCKRKWKMIIILYNCTCMPIFNYTCLLECIIYTLQQACFRIIYNINTTTNYEYYNYNLIKYHRQIIIDPLTYLNYNTTFDEFTPFNYYRKYEILP